MLRRPPLLSALLGAVALAGGAPVGATPQEGAAGAAVGAVPIPASVPAPPAITPFAAALAGEVAATGDEAVAAFYRARGFAPIWMGEGAAARRAARAAMEMDATTRFLRVARDASSGALEPKRVDPTLVLEVPRRPTADLLAALAGEDPAALVRDLWPATPMYARLLRERMRLLEVAAAGPEVPGGRLAPGARGAAVVALRDRLARMGYLGRSLTVEYGPALTEAVRRFQADHGLSADGVAGAATLRAINVAVARRLEQVAVGLERQRWMNKALEPRHVLVNLAEQHAYVVDDGKVTFDTVVVVGHPDADRRTPEFSHSMTHMVVNPTWNVPRSIAVNEYLPALRRGGARHLRLYRNGREVSRSRVNFSRYTARTFPFDLKQPPGPKNALGRVKFMFPNRWNIYLHDTQAKSLFGRDVRAFSHGCVRVGRPFDLAAHLLAPQEAAPRAAFDRILRTGVERRVNLETPVGVHIVHWSVWVDAEGRAQYRGDDVYGRDAAILAALRAAGVETALPHG